ncbi:MAG: MerR family transcriptional regulator, partial [Pseudomonadota bacterium]
MNISTASKITNLSVKTLRYYDDIGLVRPASRNRSGYRIYDDITIRKLIFIRRARAFGFSIQECHDLLALYADEKRSSADVKKIASKR